MDRESASGEHTSLGRSFTSLPGPRLSKNLAKRAIYALLLPLQRVLARRLGLRLPRMVVPSQRGTEYDLLLSRLGGRRIRDARILLQGVGDGSEAGMWRGYEPRVLVGTDLVVGQPEPDVPVVEGDLHRLPFRSRSFDITASINTFEHVKDVDRALRETTRVLTDRGMFLATFGPLFHAYGGDHFSSIRGGGLADGYNHLLLEPDEYTAFVEESAVEGADIVNGRKQAGLAYIEADLFSHLTMTQYLELFEQHLDVRYRRAHIEPQALAFRSNHPDRWQRLLDLGYQELDLLVSTLVVIAQKKGG